MRVSSILPRVAVATLLIVALAGVAEAASPACRALEAKLASLQKSSNRAAALDGAATQQRQQLAIAQTNARRSGCFGAGFFTRDQSATPACRSLVSAINSMQRNLAKLERGRSASGGAPASREAILRQLGANDCGPQYASVTQQPQQRNFLERLFNPDPQPRQADRNVEVVSAAPVNRAPAIDDGTGVAGGYDRGFGGGTYRTLCVRTCDGYYFPISYATSRNNFVTDEQVCKQMCPGADVALYAHRNPGQQSTQAISVETKAPYSELENAFAYRTKLNPGCTCGKMEIVDSVAGGYLPGATAPYSPATVPLPSIRPDAGEDPETLANRRGQLDPGEVGKPNVATPVAALTPPPSGGVVRRVGPAFYYAQ